MNAQEIHQLTARQLPTGRRPFWAFRRFLIPFIGIGILMGINGMVLGQTQTYTSDGSFIAPAGATNVTVNAWGGGGGGGGRNSSLGTTARGGGGGAFALKALNLTPSTTYTVDVGAGGLGGPAGNNAGSDGTPSLFYLTVGSPLVRAAAGSGGPANTSGNGGSGGTVANSIGDSPTPYKGGDANSGGGGGAGTTGAGGNTTSATGGTGTANGGGAGGTAITGIGNQGNGRPGNSYGGGGSGARYSSSGSYSGGNGAPGQITITYTCPTYSLASTSGAIACTNGTSIITLTGGNLPNGTYTVAYTLSGANAGTGSGTMTVTGGSGTGTFTSSLLANGGSTTITINSLTSGSGVGGATLCTSAISSGNTASFWVGAPAQPGAITGNNTPCEGSTQTYSVTNVAGVTYTWAFPSGWSQTGGGTTNSVTALVGSGSGNITVTPSNTCGNGTARTLPVTINPAPQGSLTGNSICAGGTGKFTFTTSSVTGPFSLIINGVTYNGVVSGTAFNASPNPSATTTYTLTSITDANSCTRTSGITGASAPITVNIPTFTTGSNNISCYNLGNGSITITVVNASGSYQYSLDNGLTYPYSGLSPITIPNLGIGNYLVRVKDSNNCESPLCP